MIILYGITIVSLSEELWAAEPGLLTPFYADNPSFDGSAQRSANILKLILKRGVYLGYLLNSYK